MEFRLLWKGNWFIQEKSCKILALIVRYTFANIFHHKFEGISCVYMYD